MQVDTVDFAMTTVQGNLLHHRRASLILSAMTKVLCDISALRYYRTPPRYFYALPPIPDFDTPYGRGRLRQSPVATRIIDIPIHALSFGHDRLTSTLVKQHLWSKDLPAGAIVDTPFDVAVTSPLLTLLMLSTHLDPIDTALLIYEFTGLFSLYSPSKEMDDAICQSVKQGKFERLDSWRRITSAQGKPTDLWVRKPLLEIDDIHHILDAGKGMRGRNRLAKAMRYVTGKVASPFEAKTSILIGSPRRVGGLGFAGFKNNLEIKLDDNAQRICGLKNAYGDIVWEATSDHPMVIVECQGEMAHNSRDRAQADDDRALALESMGIEVIRISYKQISDRTRFNLLARRLSDTLSIKLPNPTPRLAQREIEMRDALFGAWPYYEYRPLGTGR